MKETGRHVGQNFGLTCGTNIHNSLTPEQAEFVIDFFQFLLRLHENRGDSVVAVADAMKMFKEQNGTHVRTYPANYATKESLHGERIIAKIRDLRLAGYRHREIAGIIGKSESFVSDTCLSRGWYFDDCKGKVGRRKEVLS